MDSLKKFSRTLSDCPDYTENYCTDILVPRGTETRSRPKECSWENTEHESFPNPQILTVSIQRPSGSPDCVTASYPCLSSSSTEWEDGTAVSRALWGTTKSTWLLGETAWENCSMSVSVWAGYAIWLPGASSQLPVKLMKPWWQRISKCVRKAGLWWS